MKRLMIPLIMMVIPLLSQAQNLRYDVYATLTLDAVTKEPLTTAQQNFIKVYLRGNSLTCNEKKYLLYNKKETSAEMNSYVTYDAVDEHDQNCQVIFATNTVSSDVSYIIFIQYENSSIMYAFVSNKPIAL